MVARVETPFTSDSQTIRFLSSSKRQKKINILFEAVRRPINNIYLFTQRYVNGTSNVVSMLLHQQIILFACKSVIVFCECILRKILSSDWLCYTVQDGAYF